MQNIATLQLGIIQKPSLIHAAYGEEHRLQLIQSGLGPRFLQRCTCRTSTMYKPLRNPASYRYREYSSPRRWNTAITTSQLVHRQGCPLFTKVEEAKQFGFRLSYSGPLLAGTIQASFTMTRGHGGFSISPTLAFNPIVSSDALAFKAIDISFLNITSSTEMQEMFAFRKQALSCLYLEGKASPRDIDEEGNTVLHVSFLMQECLCCPVLRPNLESLPNLQHGFPQLEYGCKYL